MRSLSTRRSFLAGSAALGASTAALPDASRAARARPHVRLGYLDSLSGPFAVGGIPQLNGAKLAIEDANRRGGAYYELLIADDATKPAVASTEARRLVENEKVDVLLGSASSAVGNALSAYAQNAGVLYVAVGTHDTAMTGAKANKVCFRQTCSLALLSTALGAELVRRAKRWYFLVADYAFGSDARDRLEVILDAHGGRVLRRGESAAGVLSRVRSPGGAGDVLRGDAPAREAPRSQRVLPHRIGGRRRVRGGSVQRSGQLESRRDHCRREGSGTRGLHAGSGVAVTLTASRLCRLRSVRDT